MGSQAQSLSRHFSFIVLSLLALAFAGTADAGGVVNNLTEADLRAALAGGGTVTFAADGVISLTNLVGTNQPVFSLVITNDTVIDGTGHTVTLSGGGVVPILMVQTGVKLVLTRLTIADGYLLDRSGAGILNLGDLTATDCTFSNNVAVSMRGPAAGAAILHAGGALRLNGCTFVKNRSTHTAGSAIACGLPEVGPELPPDVSIAATNCTFYGNDSYGVVITSGPFTQPVWYVNCTFAWNTNVALAHYPTNFLNPYKIGTLPRMINCVFAHTVSASNVLGDVIDAGHNLSSDASDVFTNTTSLINTDPLLGALTNNGGPTWTMALLPGSPAIDAGDDAAAPPTDQRGFARPGFEHVDIGAFENNSNVPPTLIAFAASEYWAREPQGSATIQIARAGPPEEASTVLFTATNGTATSGLDFIATNIPVSFAAGETMKNVSVQLLDDQQIEGDETILLTLSDPVGADLGEPHSAVLTVTDDDGPLATNHCTFAGLQDAVSAGGMMRFDCDGTLLFTNTLNVARDIVIDGNGHNVVLDGCNAVRLFNVEPHVQLTLKDLTLTHGWNHGEDGFTDLTDGEGRAGAVFVDQGILTVIGCRFWTNSAVGGAGSSNFADGNGGSSYGGAIALQSGMLNATNSEFMDNFAKGGGGGYSEGYGTAHAVGGAGTGGAIYGLESLLNLEGCSFQVNAGQGGAAGTSQTDSTTTGKALGGALFFTQSTSVVARCTFTANRVVTERIINAEGLGGDVAGGAIGISDGAAAIVQTEFTSNSATGGSGSLVASFAGSGRGGAVANWGATDILLCTFDHNFTTAGYAVIAGGDAEGGAVFNADRLQVEESDFLQNTSQGGPAQGTKGRGRGGAIFNGDFVQITASTFDANQAVGADGSGYAMYEGSGTIGFGGALFSTGTAHITNSTFSANSARGGAGSLD